MLSTDKIIEIVSYDRLTDTASLVYEIPVRIRPVSLLGTSANSEVTIIKSGLQDTVPSLERATVINWKVNQYTATATGLIVSGTGAVNTAIAAAGGNQGAAAALSLQYNVVTSATASSADGVRLPVITPLAVFTIVNTTAVTVKVYPATNDYIGSGAQNASVNLAAGSRAIFYAKSTAVTNTAGYGWVQLA